MTKSDNVSKHSDGNQIDRQFLENMKVIAQSVSAIYERTIALLEPQVSSLIQIGSTDVGQIESLLDQLLDVCDDERALRLFRQLCRHYWTISPHNTAIYIQGYRSMWEAEND